MDDFEKELKTGFLEEASQLVSDTEQCFLALESNPGDAATLDKIFRLAHNLKGSSKAVGFEDIGVFTHRFESFLLQLKKGELAISSPVINLLLLCNDHIRSMVDTLRQDLDARIDSSELMAQIESASAGAIAALEAPALSEKDEEVLEKATSESLQGGFEGEPEATSEEIELAKVVQESLEADPLQAIPQPPPRLATSPEESIRVSLGRLEKLLNSVGELVILQSVLREQAAGFNPHLLRKTIHQMGKVTKEVQDISMSLRMVPLRQTFQKMQRIVRDTGNLLGKKVMLSTAGDDTELDKTVLEHISDPLVHLIRNACDHGIETPEKRIAAGKTETGFVALRAFHQSGKLVIEVKDDGGGIDGERLQQKAVEKGILKPGTRLSPQDAIQLIFHPGFSTKAQVTEVSGRGVGMDVVKTNIEALQGEVLVETELGKGTTFKVSLPLTLAIIDGMVVRNGACRFVVPLSHVHETLRPTSKEVHTATGLGEVLMLRGENLPLYRLSQLFGQKRTEQQDAREQIAMVIRYTGQPFAVMVDDVLGQQQVVIKEVGPEIQSLRWMSGSAILGDGKPAIILEMNELVKPAKRGAA
ncbi:chemotaxis protein CheA [bacterium]|jgi:two-component system chemotaxis sensor kinase CheA|nr:chemotaxis protein CheA [bacterium]